jgi:hypothetical protein
MQCEADYFVLLISLSVATIHAATSSGDLYTFPEGFMLGSATASYQIEGGWKEDGKSEQQNTNLLSDIVLSNTEILRTKIDFLYSKTCLKRNIKGPEYFSAKARFPFNQGTLHTV